MTLIAGTDIAEKWINGRIKSLVKMRIWKRKVCRLKSSPRHFLHCRKNLIIDVFVDIEFTRICNCVFMALTVTSNYMPVLTKFLEHL